MTRARTERMATALARIAAGEVAYRVARDLGIATAQIYAALKAERAKRMKEALEIVAELPPMTPEEQDATVARIYNSLR